MQEVFARLIHGMVRVMFLNFFVPLAGLAAVPSLLIAQAENPAEAAPPNLNVAPVEKTGTLPPDTTSLAQKAAAAFAKHEWETARTAYREMLSVDAANALAWANLGAVEQQSGRPREAAECFEKSVLHNPRLAQSWIALGLIYAQKGDSYKAISMFTRAIHEEPEDARAHNYLAISARALGWTDAAAAELQRAIELQPDYGIAHFNLALVFLDQRPPAMELARRHYEKALSLGVEKDEIVERRLKE